MLGSVGADGLVEIWIKTADGLEDGDGLEITNDSGRAEELTKTGNGGRELVGGGDESNCDEEDGHHSNSRKRTPRATQRAPTHLLKPTVSCKT